VGGSHCTATQYAPTINLSSHSTAHTTIHYNGSLATAEGSALVEPTARKFSCVIGMADIFHTITPQMLPTHHRRHRGVSARVASIKVHIWIHWTCNPGVCDSK